MRVRLPGRAIDIAVAAVVALSLDGLTVAAEPSPSKIDLSKDSHVFVVGTAHLDTQWGWTIQATINAMITKTLRQNFALIEEYPNYVFSFEGAIRYQLAKEYWPEEWEQLKKYVAAGRWAPAGSAIDAGDVNIPSTESLIRQFLYGNGFFRKEFGKTSCDIFLPDCFGFGHALPTVAAHCGLRLDFKPFQPRTVALTIRPIARLDSPNCATVALPFDADMFSSDATGRYKPSREGGVPNRPVDGDADGAGGTLPGEQLPERLTSDGVAFAMGSTADGAMNAVVCKGQKIALPAGAWKTAHLIAAAVGEDREVTFAAGDRQVKATVCDLWENVGAWDKFKWDPKRSPPPGTMRGRYAKALPLAWYATHRLQKSGAVVPYRFGYLWRVAVPPRGYRCRTASLPG